MRGVDRNQEVAAPPPPTARCAPVTTLRALMTALVLVLGLRPIRSFLERTTKFPKRLRFTTPSKTNRPQAPAAFPRSSEPTLSGRVSASPLTRIPQIVARKRPSRHAPHPPFSLRSPGHMQANSHARSEQRHAEQHAHDQPLQHLPSRRVARNVPRRARDRFRQIGFRGLDACAYRRVGGCSGLV